MENSILVTGAGGFIGSAVVRNLVRAMESRQLKFADGSDVEKVFALVRNSSFPQRLQELSKSQHWSLVHTDINDQSAFRQTLENTRPRVIMHLALESIVFTNIAEEEMHRVNVAPLESMFKYLSRVPGSRLIHTGSAWVLEPGIDLAEDTDVYPHSPYAKAKIILDKLLPELQARYGVDWINLRLFNVYGKYESDQRLMPYLVSTLPYGKKAKLSHGNQLRDFNEVDDVSEAYALALRAGINACGQVYHIGTGHGLTIREFSKIVAEVTGNSDLINFGTTETPDQNLTALVANPSLAQKKLGWSPPRSPEEKIRQAAEWWMKYYNVP